MTLQENIIKKANELIDSISTMHLDMGGKHRYTLSYKSHKLITELKAMLYEDYRRKYENKNS